MVYAAWKQVDDGKQLIQRLLNKQSLFYHLNELGPMAPRVLDEPPPVCVKCWVNVIPPLGVDRYKEAAARQEGVRRLIDRVEAVLFHGNQERKPSTVDGFPALQASTERGVSNILDLNGAPLSRQVIDKAANMIRSGGGDPSHLFLGEKSRKFIHTDRDIPGRSSTYGAIRLVTSRGIDSSAVLDVDECKDHSEESGGQGGSPIGQTANESAGGDSTPHLSSALLFDMRPDAIGLRWDGHIHCLRLATTCLAVRWLYAIVVEPVLYDPMRIVWIKNIGANRARPA